MKKVLKLGLVASATMLALGVAQAASVSLYGSISTGLVFSGTDKIDGEDRVNSLSMESAWYGDSIWGLTGEEEIGGGWKVGFTLENEYGSDTGALAGGDDGQIFDSQAYLQLSNDVITIAAGRIGAIDSAGGDFDLVGGFDPLEAAFGVGGMGGFASRDATYDNSILLSLAPVEGLTLTAMASLGDGGDDGQWNKTRHYMAVGGLYENGPLAVGLTAAFNKYKGDDWEAADSDDGDNLGTTITFGLSWDFEVIKPMFMYQHGSHLQEFQDVLLPDLAENCGSGLKTDSFLLGATVPIGEGTLMVAAQYARVELEDTGDKGNVKIIGVAYNYEFSERTSLYVGATWSRGGDEMKRNGGAFDGDLRAAYNGYQVGLGVNHVF